MTYSGATDRFAHIEATLDRIDLSIERTQAIQEANAQQIAANLEAIAETRQTQQQAQAENLEAIIAMRQSQASNIEAITALNQAQQTNQTEHSEFRLGMQAAAENFQTLLTEIARIWQRLAN